MNTKELIPMDDYGMFADTHYTARVSSLFVASFFKKEHKHVLESIRNVTGPNSGLSEEFRKTNFTADTYCDTTGRNLPCYQMTRDGYTILVMGYNGKNAMKFKEAYIKRFNEMEFFIKTLVECRHEFPLLTENIKLIHDDPRPYHFSNECDMLNRIVTGMTAKMFRKKYGLENGTSIRPYLTDDQINLLDTLQKVDVGLLISTPEFEKRKHFLQWYISHKNSIVKSDVKTQSIPIKAISARSENIIGW